MKPGPDAESTAAADRWSRVTEIVDGALRRPDPKERSRYLRQACAGDGRLRREVDDLLRFEKDDREILARPARQRPPPAPPQATDPQAAAPEPGEQIGPYRVVRRLGDGGMGIVVHAHDPELGRDVALKLIHPERLSEEALRRFENERRILARLDHPHVARIYGGGLHRSQPYFAMELVAGDPVDTWCDEQRLSIDDRIRLLLKVCDALAEAHRNLVVHRDLKPGNVLVTSDGEPKLLDFGIAKELEPDPETDGALTRTGHQPLSLAYASPEQVRGRSATVGSDVYAVGVLLYRLLCGHPPYELDSDHVENVLKICRQEPPPPSTRALVAREVWHNGAPIDVSPDLLARRRRTDPRALRRRLCGDLDGIVAKALAKDPHHRYRSMEHLAEDLRRHLQGLPVTARRATWPYRAARFLRRHRWRLTAAAVLAVALSGGLGGWLRSRNRARASAEQAAEAERQAEALTLFARNLVRAADPDASGGRPLSARVILERGREEARRTLAGQPEALAHQLEALGLAYQSLGELEAAQPLLEESLELRRQVYAGDHRLIARGLNNLAALLYLSDERPEAEALYRSALAMKRRLGRPPEELEKVEGNLATLLAFRGELAESEALYRNILARRRQAYKPGDLDLATSLRNLGNVLYLKGDFDAAEDALREALQLRLDADQDADTRTASVLASLGRVLHARGRRDEAERVLTAALAIRRRLLGAGHLHTALTEKDLASVYFDLGEDAVAEVLWGRAEGVLRANKPSDAWELADLESRLGARLAAQGRFGEAEVCLRESYETLARVRGEQALYTRQAWTRLEEVSRWDDRPQEDAEGSLQPGPSNPNGVPFQSPGQAKRRPGLGRQPKIRTPKGFYKEAPPGPTVDPTAPPPRDRIVVEKGAVRSRRHHQPTRAEVLFASVASQALPAWVIGRMIPDETILRILRCQEPAPCPYPENTVSARYPDAALDRRTRAREQAVALPSRPSRSPSTRHRMSRRGRKWWTGWPSYACSVSSTIRVGPSSASIC